MSRSARIFIGNFPKKPLLTGNVSVVLTSVVATSAPGTTTVLVSLNNKRISAMHFQKPWEPIAFGV